MGSIGSSRLRCEARPAKGGQDRFNSCKLGPDGVVARMAPFRAPAGSLNTHPSLITGMDDLVTGCNRPEAAPLCSPRDQSPQQQP